MKRENAKSVFKVLFLTMLVAVLMPADMNAQKTREGQHVKKTAQKTRTVNAKKTPVSNRRVVTPARNYNNRPYRNQPVARVPNNARAIRYNNANYHYHNGIFYRNYNNAYVVTHPPRGIRINVLPPNPFLFALGARNYYYYHGTYYSSVDNGEYEVIQPPVGAVINELPDGFETVEFDNRIYYQFDDTYYKAIVGNNGQVMYEVVKV